MFGKNQSVVSPKSTETIIGPSVRVEGDFKGDGDLIIEGMLVGTLNTKNNLKIGENAVLEASIKANNAFIAGRVKGNITIKGKLDITSSAVILGDIKAGLISIESGAVVQGNLSMPINDGAREETRITKKENKKNEAETEAPLPLES